MIIFPIKGTDADKHRGVYLFMQLSGCVWRVMCGVDGLNTESEGLPVRHNQADRHQMKNSQLNLKTNSGYEIKMPPPATRGLKSDTPVTQSV